MCNIFSMDMSNDIIDSSYEEEADMGKLMTKFANQEEYEETEEEKVRFTSNGYGIMEFSEDDYDTDSLVDYLSIDEEEVNSSVNIYLTDNKLEETSPTIETIDNFQILFKGKLEEMIKDTNGSKFLLKCFPLLSTQIRKSIYDEIEESIPDLINNENGKEFCESLVNFILSESVHE